MVHALHVIELGLDIAFVTPQQSQSTLDAMPPGTRVMQLGSGGAAAKAGINFGDIIEAIGNQKIDPLDDMRKTFRQLGPRYRAPQLRRSGERLPPPAGKNPIYIARTGSQKLTKGIAGRTVKVATPNTRRGRRVATDLGKL
jgi:hypothetical protein